MISVLDRISHNLFDELEYNKLYSNIYKTHKYWSRKPWYLVEKYIKKYSVENEIVLDPFMGSGCTGVEALLNNRNFIGYDLNPISKIIAEGTAKVVPDLTELRNDFEIILKKAKGKILSCYETNCKCAQCNNDLYIKYICIGPGAKIKNRAMLFCKRCGARSKVEKVLAGEPKEEDYESLLSNIWKPDIPFPDKFYKDRFSYKGIRLVSDMYTKRNLYCLCLLLEVIKTSRLKHRDLAMLAFSNTVLHCSFLKGENVRPLSVNNYWIPNDYIEENVWCRFEERYNNILKSKQVLNNRIHEKKKLNNSFEIKIQSSLHMDYNNVADYVFTDPPYGDAIQYSELSFMYNVWLGYNYDTKEEIIINPCQSKNQDYFIEAIKKSIKKIYLALKPEKFFTLCFQNKNYRIWKEVIECCKDMGFRLEDISIYNTYGNPYNKSWAKFSPKSDIYVTFKKTDEIKKSRYFLEKNNLKTIMANVINYFDDNNLKKDNSKIYDMIVGDIIWELYYNQNGLDVDDFTIKNVAKMIENSFTK